MEELPMLQQMGLLENNETAAFHQSLHSISDKFKEYIGLEKYQSNLWTKEHEKQLSELLSGKAKKIFMYVDTEGKLVISSTIPSLTTFDELQYFIRKESLSLEDSDFDMQFHFGILKGSLLESLLRVIKNLYAPMVMDQPHWPESIRKDFSTQLHRFLAFLTDCTYLQKGAIVLYVPPEKITDPHSSAQNKEIVQRFESTLLHWTRQIKDVVNSQNEAETRDNTGLTDEYEFWKTRCEDLSSITAQLEREEVQKIVQVLEIAKSSYLDQFRRLSQLIIDSSLEAKENLKFLGIIAEPCRQLQTSELKDIVSLLPNLLNIVRLIWTHSKYHNSNERLTGILRKISHEIIKRCVSKISLDEIFNGNTAKGSEVLNDCIYSGEAWKALYIKMKSYVQRKNLKLWDFDMSSIFAQMDAFVQRCRDLLEVIESYNQFANNAKEIGPFIGGTKGPEISKNMADIEVAFDKQLKILWQYKHIILDVKVTQWHEIFNTFKKNIKDLEIRFQNVIMVSFEQATYLERFVDLLDLFTPVARKDSIKRALDKKTLELKAKVLQDLNHIKTEFETQRRQPEIFRFHPNYAGSAFWAKSLQKRAKRMMEILQSSNSIPLDSFLSDIQIHYEPLNTSIEDYISKTHQDWIQTLQTQENFKLNTPLMVRTENGDLKDHFDSQLKKTIHEITYWQKLKMDIPSNVQEYIQKKEELRILESHVQSVVKEYNLILDEVYPEERSLFREKCKFLDKKMMPGLSNLSWQSKGVTEYFIKECRKYTLDLKQLVHKFQLNNIQIHKCCVSMAQTLLCHIENNKIYELEEFEYHQQQYRLIVRDKLLSLYQSIHQSLSQLFQLFRFEQKDTMTHWLKYIEKIEDVIETALRHSVHQSLMELSKSLMGEGKNNQTQEWRPLFKVNVVLDNQKIEFMPSLQFLEQQVNHLAREMISIISVIPRLSEYLNLNATTTTTASSTATKPLMYDIIAREEEVLKQFVLIQTALSQNLQKSQHAIKHFDPYREIYEINKDAFIRRYSKLNPAISTFDADLNRYSEVANNVQKEEVYGVVGMVRLDFGGLKGSIVRHCMMWQQKLSTLLNQNALSDLKGVVEFFESKSEGLMKRPEGLDGLSDLVQLIQSVHDELPGVKERILPIHEQYQILEKYEVPLKDDEKLLLTSLEQRLLHFEEVLAESERMLQDEKMKQKSQLLNQVDEFGKQLLMMREELESEGPFMYMPSEIALKQIDQYKKRVEDILTKERTLRKGLSVFRIEQQSSRDLDSVVQMVEWMNQIWQMVQEYDLSFDKWLRLGIHELSRKEMEELCLRMVKRMEKLKEVREWGVYQYLWEKSERVLSMMPILDQLTQSSLRERHWMEMTQLLGRAFSNLSGGLTFGQCWEYGVDQYAVRVGEICHRAPKEYIIEQTLSDIQTQWQHTSITLQSYKNYHKVQSLSQIVEWLENHRIQLGILKQSQYSKVFEREIQELESLLDGMEEFVLRMEGIQKQWGFLENIFHTGQEDIRRQLPRESLLFDSLHDRWQSILMRMRDLGSLLEVVQNHQVKGELEEVYGKLEKIEKSLDLYLETKRKAFPRFYLLSHEDLLEILGLGRQPSLLQYKLRSCFESISRLELRGDTVAGIWNSDLEYLKFEKEVLMSGSVEEWFLEIETQMKQSLKSELLQCMIALKKGKREKFVFQFMSQVVVLSSLLTFTLQVEHALSSGVESLSVLKQKYLQMMTQMIELSRRVEDLRGQLQLDAYMMHLVHLRDILSILVKSSTTTGNNDDWMIQMRYYYEQEQVIVRQQYSQFEYGYELMGISRLVCTPLTDKCLRSLTTALGHFRGGLLMGPAGTGKTETVKELGKKLGRFVLVLNVTETLTPLQFSRFLMGLSQSGVFLCLDEFNRMQTETLSIVAVQLSSLFHALHRHQDKFTGCGVFMTMNPTSEARYPLPDSLKSLLRQTSVHQPDQLMICEVLMVCSGFLGGRKLARVLVGVFRAMSESMYEYVDVSLRSMISVLRLCRRGMRQMTAVSGGVTAASGGVSEESVLLTALVQEFQPRLTEGDSVVFHSILRDYLPGVEVQQSTDQLMSRIVREKMEQMNLVSNDGQMKKILDLYYLSKVHQSIILVGESGSGKSTCWQTLLQSLNAAAAGTTTGTTTTATTASITTTTSTTTNTNNKIKYHLLHPCAVPITELYGQQKNQEWQDGLIPQLLRQSTDQQEEVWIILDGTVYPVWMESMNSLLDESRILTLGSGERIRLGDGVKILFETDTLAYASPAMISRCAVVHFDRKDVEWDYILDSWMIQQPESPTSQILQKLVKKYIQPAIQYRRQLESLLPLSEINLLQTFCKILTALIGQDNIDRESEMYPKTVELWILFSIIWSIGGNLTDDSQKKFEMFFRTVGGQFPSKDTIYSYFVDHRSSSWQLWDQQLQHFPMRLMNDLPQEYMFIPTFENVKYLYLSKLLTSVGASVLLTGETSVGKTIMLEYLKTIDRQKYHTASFKMTSLTKATSFHQYLDSRLERQGKNVMVPIGSDRLLICVDDLNSARDLPTNAPSEFMKQLMNHQYWYDRQSKSSKEVKGLFFMATYCTDQRIALQERLLNQFCVFHIQQPSRSALVKVMQQLFMMKFCDFDEEVKSIGNQLGDLTIDLHLKLRQNFIPTTIKQHYHFEMRDMISVIRGLFRANREYYDSKEALIGLWIHEMQRVYQDRFVEESDLILFQQYLSEYLKTVFEVEYQQIVKKKRFFMFTDLPVHGGKTTVYQEIQDSFLLFEFLESKLKDFNAQPQTTRMDISLFTDAMAHVLHLHRLLQQPRGHLILVGPEGCGRTSFLKLAAYLCQLSVMELKSGAVYEKGPDLMQKSLQQIYQTATVQNKPVICLVRQHDLKRQLLLEQVLNLVTGTIDLDVLSHDEFQQIKQQMVPQGQKGEVDVDYFGLAGQRLFNNVRVVLCVSADQHFQTIYQSYSVLQDFSLLWFREWSNETILEVAKKRFEEHHELTEKQKIFQVFCELQNEASQSCQRNPQKWLNTFVPPMFSVDLMERFKKIYNQKNDQLKESLEILHNGLNKLEETREKIQLMTKDLELKKKNMMDLQRQCEEFLVAIVQQKREADEQTAIVAAQNMKLQAEESEFSLLATSAQNDLGQVLSGFNSAIQQLESLSRKDLQEIKSYGKPPPLVEKVMEAIMILKKVEPTWEEAKRQLGQQNFINQLIEFDKDNISDKILKRVSQYCADEQFDPEIIGKVSGAAKSLAVWVKAIESYAILYRQIAPKREKLAVAQEQMSKKHAALKESQLKLEEIQQRLQQISEQYDQKVKTKEDLRKEIDMTEIKLGRADLLVNALGNERDRWQQMIDKYSEQRKFLVGDSLLAASYLTYSGPLALKERKEWMDSSKGKLKHSDISFSNDFNFLTLMNSSLDQQDDLIAENFIFISHSNRCFLLYDPQEQAIQFLKSHYSDLQLTNTATTQWRRILTNSILAGNPVFLTVEGIFSDPDLEAIVFAKKNQEKICHLQRESITIHPDFKLFISVSSPNCLVPAMLVNLTILNFLVTKKGLEEKVLSFIVKKEQPELENRKRILTTDIQTSDQNLKEMEQKVLALLFKSSSSFLDDSSLVDLLNNTKKASEEVAAKKFACEQAQKSVDHAREVYRKKSEQIAALFFIASDFAAIQPLFCLPLNKFFQLLGQSLQKTQKSNNLEDRLNNISQNFSNALYKNVSQSLNTANKTLFAFRLALVPLLEANKISQSDYDFFIKEQLVVERQPNILNSWMNDEVWNNLTLLNSLPSFSGIQNTIIQNEQEWRQWFTSADPEERPLPGEWDQKLDQFQKLLFIRTIRLDRLEPSMQKFIFSQLGNKFSHVQMDSNFIDINIQDLSPVQPLVFLVSPGVDPREKIDLLAEKHNMINRIKYLSLGRGQAAKATRTVREGMQEGFWIYLANVHLLKHWVTDLAGLLVAGQEMLDQKLQQQANVSIHDDFRIILSTEAFEGFPKGVLEKSLVVALERGDAIKSGLAKFYSAVDDEYFAVGSSEKQNDSYRKAYYCLSVFHSLLLARRKFVPFGFTTDYDLSDADFEFASNIIREWAQRSEPAPWSMIRYMVVELVYGSKISEEIDLRILRSFAKALFDQQGKQNDSNEHQLPVYRHSIYKLPESLQVEQIKNFILSLSEIDDVEVVGLHSNASIENRVERSKNIMISLKELDKIYEVEPLLTMEVLDQIIGSIPEPIEIEIQPMNGQQLSPEEIVLKKEWKIYIDALRFIKRSLVSIKEAMIGHGYLTPDLIPISKSLALGQVPISWAEQTFWFNEQNLMAWIENFNKRFEYLRKFITTKPFPEQIWLGVLCHPASYLSAKLVSYSRSHKVPVESVHWEVASVHLTQESLSNATDYQLQLNHIVLEGANIDQDSNGLVDPLPLQSRVTIPAICLRVNEKKKKLSKTMFHCPLFADSRRDRLLMWLEMSSGQYPPEHWLLRGVVMLCL